MRKSRVRLGPHLLAQTQPNPPSRSPQFTKAFGVVLILLLAVFAVSSFRGGDKTDQAPSAFPEEETVLGAEKALAPNEDYYLYEVKKGDSLFTISETFQVGWEEVVKLNSLKEPFILQPGQKIKLPANAVTRRQRFYDNLKKKIYVVEEGDTFVGIAQKLNISVTDLLRANADLASPDLIQIGQVLKLP